VPAGGVPSLLAADPQEIEPLGFGTTNRDRVVADAAGEFKVVAADDCGDMPPISYLIRSRGRAIATPR